MNTTESYLAEIEKDESRKQEDNKRIKPLYYKETEYDEKLADDFKKYFVEGYNIKQKMSFSFSEIQNKLNSKK